MSLAGQLSRYSNAGAGGLFRLWKRRGVMVRRALPEDRTPGRNDPRVVVTLTTIPSRIAQLQPTLNSLVDQDAPADDIVLALPRLSRREGAAYAVPPWLERSRAVRVLRCERDWGPACKLIPALTGGPDDRTLLVVVDDDNIYPPDLISTFVRWHRVYPDAALGYRGWVMPPSLDSREASARFATALREPLAVDVLTATWGIAVQPRFFDAALMDYTRAPGDAFFVDDIWINGHLARRHVPRRLVPARLPPLPTRAARIRPLGEENDDGHRKNAVIQHFREHWLGSEGAAERA